MAHENEQAAGTDQVTGHSAGRLDKILDSFLAIVLLVELLVMFGNIAIRFVTGQSFIWGQEVAELALAVLTFLGGAVAYRRGQLMATHAVVERLPVAWRPVLAALVDWTVFLGSLIAFALSLPMFRDHWHETTPILGLRQSWAGVPLTLGMLFLVYFSLRRLLQQQRRVVVWTGIVTAMAVLLVVGSRAVFGPWPMAAVMIMSALLFFFLLAIGVSIAFVLLLVATVYLYAANAAPMVSVPVSLHGATGSFILLAIPFFILAGFIMTEGGLSKPLAEAVRALFGHFRGGLLQVIVVTMYIFSGISGAKVADVAAVGTTMKDMLREGGYDPAESTAVLASSAVMGETIPPSIAMLVLGSISSLSVGALFMAGLVPAAFMAILLMLTAYVRSRMAGMQPGRRPTFTEAGRRAVKAIPAFLVVVIMIVGILEGIATPTEISSVAVVYALVLAFGSRQLSLRNFWKVMSDTASMAGMILFMISAGTIFSLALTMVNLPNQIAGLLTGMSDSQWIFIAASILTLVVMGALLEGLPALLIFGPLLLPVASQLGIDGLHMGIVLIFAMGLGAFLPPIGVGMYVSCSVGGTTMEAATKRMIPYILVLTIGLLLVAFVPWMSLGLPHMLHMNG